MLSMVDNYRLLNYLYASKPDRQYPHWTPDEDTSDNPSPEPLSGSELVLTTISENYSGIDFIEVAVNPNGNILRASDFSFSFSALLDGSLSMVEFLPVEDGDLPSDKPFLLTFNVDKNTSMHDLSRRLTGVKSIKISINHEVKDLEFLDIVFKSKDYTYTLANLENAYHDGENYVLSTLNSFENEGLPFNDVPELLKRYVFMAGSAFAWLEHWEYESKPMKQNTIQSNNYADRLLYQVDKGIENYVANLKKDFNEICLNDNRFLKSRRLSWGL